MTGQERWELYEDEALDRQIMGQLMKAEGRQLSKLIAKLENDQEAVPPEALEQRWLNALDEASRPRRNVRKAAVRIFRCLAAAVLAASLMFASAFAAFEEVRAGTLKLLVEIVGSYTHYKLVPNPQTIWAGPQQLSFIDTETLLGYRFPEMPDDFTAFQEYKTTTQATVQYRREDGAEISITVSSYALGNSSVSTNDAQVEDVSIQGYDGQLISRRYLLADGQTAPWSQLLWGNTDAGVLVSIVGYRIEGQVLSELAGQACWVGLNENDDCPSLLGYQIVQLPEGFRLEAYGRTETEHYAQYRLDEDTSIRLRVSLEELCFDEFKKYLFNQTTISSTTIRGYPGQIAHTNTGLPSHQPNEILLWSEPSDNGLRRYLWLEGKNVPQETLCTLAESLHLSIEAE